MDIAAAQRRGLAAVVLAAAAWVPTGPVSAPSAAPAVSVTTAVRGLSHPWDIAFTADRAMLFTQRGGVIAVRLPDGTVRALRADLSDLLVSGETGLMGLVADPGFASNRRVYTCQGHAGRSRDIRVVAWRVGRDYSALERLTTVVSGIPVTSGQHGGCRLRFDRTGALHIGTGDATVGTNPQDLRSLGGKTLRVRPDGTVPPDNPFARAADPRTRLVYTYGHRNVQGMALRPGTGQMWAVEHGPDVDDEVNVLVAGRNYGWDPVPGYNQRAPMTDLRKFPHAVRARWSSGQRTVATSGAAFLGAKWGSWRGGIVVVALKGSEILVLSPGGRLLVVLRPGYGRLRAAQLGPDGDLYVSTDNGSDDRVLRLTPRG